MSFDTSTELTDSEIDQIITDEIARRSVGPAATIAAGAGANAAKSAIQGGLVKALRNEFDDIRNDPERAALQMDQMVRTYENYLAQGNNPVEYFIDRPGEDRWAAAQRNGEDYVIFDSSAPHPAVMAHELGHVQMNHSNDPLSVLQHSGLGRLSGNLALPIGLASGYAGFKAGGPKRRVLGSAIGGALGTAASSGNFLYELPGASGRALGYLPEDVDQADAAGDLLRAGMTYGMAGPGTAAAASIVGAGAAGLASNPEFRRMAGQVLARA